MRAPAQITTEHLRSGRANDVNAAIGRSSLAPFHSPISSLVIDLFWGEIVRHPHIHSDANKRDHSSHRLRSLLCLGDPRDMLIAQTCT
jgi:hypothetical protein